MTDIRHTGTHQETSSFKHMAEKTSNLTRYLRLYALNLYSSSLVIGLEAERDRDRNSTAGTINELGFLTSMASGLDLGPTHPSG